MLNDEERPILSGLVALVSVALAVGLVIGISALIGTRMFGLGGDSDTSSDSGAGATLYLPTPEKTQSASGPLITLAPGESTPATTITEPVESPSGLEARISLSASSTSVTPFEQIDLTGVYVGGEGAILQVQRLEGGVWKPFPVTVSVSGSAFSTYVQTSRPGINEFRVIDLDTQLASNSVRVKISG